MTARIIAVQPFDLVVFGGTGDLAQRKLLPALYMRFHDGQMPEDARVVGVSRQEMTDEGYRAFVAEALQRHVRAEHLKPGMLEPFLAVVHYRAVDAKAESGWKDLAAVLDTDARPVRAFYLATAPELFGLISQQLQRHGLARPGSRVVIEKPIGKDRESADAVNAAVGAVFPEPCIFRIDHYLGKETVQNLLALRFGNALFEPLWNSAHIDHVQITVAESLGLEARAGYYDTSGALRDMVQNHMLQLLCLTAMEPPASIAADAVRDEKLKVLRSLAPIDEATIDQRTVRGQYLMGASESGQVKGYLDELGRRDSTTETFVALHAEVRNWRWAGVPFFLRTGKRLATRVSEIVITFRNVPHSVFGGVVAPLDANRLVMRLQPDEGVRLFLMIKEPGPGGMRLKNVSLDMSFAEAFGVRQPDAYERLIMDVIRGNATLFMRRDEVDAAWAWIDPIEDAWSRGLSPLVTYRAGTWGPSASIALIERTGRSWHEDGMA
jgi:glucose-6-phosphate 1-dehydrogenase